MNNPLLDYARKAELSVKLPSDGNWYTSDIVKLNPLKEVEVYPMLPKDELTLINPDALLSGQANIDVIKSCVPAISNPELLLYPDLNVLLLAIKAATYGDELKLEITCPHCLEIKEQLKDKPEEITKLEKENRICLHPQMFTYSCREILEQISLLEKEYIIKAENGLQIYISPNTTKDKNLFNLLNFKEKSILKQFKDYKFDNDNQTENDRKEFVSTVSGIYMNISEIGNKIVTNGIKKVELPDGSFVDDKNLIYEFVSNSNVQIVLWWIVLIIPNIVGAVATFAYFVLGKKSKIYSIIIYLAAICGMFRIIYSNYNLIVHANQYLSMNSTVRLVLGIAIHCLVIYQTYVLWIKRQNAIDIS